MIGRAEASGCSARISQRTFVNFLLAPTRNIVAMMLAPMKMRKRSKEDCVCSARPMSAAFTQSRISGDMTIGRVGEWLRADG